MVRIHKEYFVLFLDKLIDAFSELIWWRLLLKSCLCIVWTHPNWKSIPRWHGSYLDWGIECNSSFRFCCEIGSASQHHSLRRVFVSLLDRVVTFRELAVFVAFFLIKLSLSQDLEHHLVPTGRLKLLSRQEFKSKENEDSDDTKESIKASECQSWPLRWFFIWWVASDSVANYYQYVE